MRPCQQRVGLNTKFRAAYGQFFWLFFPSLHDFLVNFLDCFVRDCFVYAPRTGVSRLIIDDIEFSWPVSLNFDKNRL